MTAVDITELILCDHHEQRRMFAMLDDVDRADTATLGALWTRLSAMLEVHAQAEELYFYPELLKLGERRHEDEEVEETKDAIGDHNDIRDGILEARRHEVGTDGWWNGVPRPARPTTSTWARRSTRAWPTSAGTSTSTPGTASPCSSPRTRPPTSTASPSRTRTPTVHQGQLRSPSAAVSSGRSVCRVGARVRPAGAGRTWSAASTTSVRAGGHGVEAGRRPTALPGAR